MGIPLIKLTYLDYVVLGNHNSKYVILTGRGGGGQLGLKKICQPRAVVKILDTPCPMLLQKSQWNGLRTKLVNREM
jgi:hypothetical protein